MNQKIKTLFFVICITLIVLIIPLLLTHDTPIPVNLVQLDTQELAAQKQATAQAEKQAQRQARAARVYSCKADEDCIIVDKDPCGCAIGPKGVTAINVNYILDFNSLTKSDVTTACPEKLSQEKECSSAAHPVCKANRCKISY